MTRVFIVGNPAPEAERVQTWLGEEGIEVHAMSTAAAALQEAKGLPPDVVIVEFESIDDSIRVFIQSLERSVGEFSWLGLTDEASANDVRAAMELGAVTVLNRPLNARLVRHAVGRASDSLSGFRGSIHGLSLVDILQMFNLSRRTMTIEVGGKRGGAIHFLDGQIVHAVAGTLTGEAALRKLLEAKSGSIRTEAYEPGSRSIHRDFSLVLLDAMRVDDEHSRDIEIAARRISGDGDADPDVASDDDVVSIEERLVGGGDPRANLLEVVEPEPLEDDEEFVGATPVLNPANLGGPSILERFEPLGFSPSRPPLALAAFQEMEPAAGSDVPQNDVHEEVQRSHDPLCQAVVDEIEGAVACALIALADGRLVGRFNRVSFRADFEEMLAEYAREIFVGDKVRQIEKRVVEHRGAVGSSGFLEEVLLSSRFNFHLLKRINDSRHLIVLVTGRRGASEPQWAQLRSLVPGIEINLPD